MIAFKMEKMRTLESMRPEYGDTIEINAWTTFEEEVDQTPSNTIVIVNVFQDVCWHSKVGLN